jgi:AraC family transcriptional regulator
LRKKVWETEQLEFHQRMAALGATPRLTLRSSDESVSLSHADFDAYEGQFEKEPFLRLHLCTAHIGRLSRIGADGAWLEGVLRPGTFGITMPNTEAEGCWPRTQALTIMIKPSRLSEIDEDSITLEKLEPVASVLHRDPLVASVMSALLRDAEAHGLTSAFFDHGLDLILKRLAELKDDIKHKLTRPMRPLSRSHLRSALEFIESRLDSDFKVRELSDACGQDVRSFTRSFRASTGSAPYEYFTYRRMESAKRLLLSKTPITEVAFSVGYSNPSKFSAAFRRFYGFSPSQWRRDQG